MKKNIRNILMKNNLLESLWFYLSWVDVDHSRMNFILKSIFERQRIHNPSKNLPMILIGQIQRSGGTLMAQLFDGHSQIYCHPPELYWGKPHKWDWPSFNVEDITCDRLYYRLLYETWIVQGAAKGALNFGKESKPNIFPFKFNVRIQRKIFFNLLSNYGVANRRDVLNYYLEAFYASWLDYQNLTGQKKYHVAFTPRVSNHEKSVRKFFDDYPDGYLIHIFRHPAAWWASARKHKQQEYGDINSLKLWETSTKNAVKMKKKYKNKIICINFDELVANTKLTMQRICQYVGIKWENILL